MRTFLLGLSLLSTLALAQQNQLASTPPMGWISWNLFEGNINETLVHEIADVMVANGYKDLGYEYIILDDLWQGGRDENGNVFPDPEKFPSGMKALGDYIHSRGLKFGIYTDAAEWTCAGAAGSYGFEKKDARTYADWGVDYVKCDYCNAPEDIWTAVERYKSFIEEIREVRPGVVFAVCEWGQRSPWLWGKEIGANLWRTTWDLRDTWEHGKYTNRHNGIMEALDRQVGLEKFAGPGHWNDPDILMVGLNGKGNSASANEANGCSIVEYEAHMGLWALLSAPLLMCCDIRYLDLESKRILHNKELISVNQDPLGKQATRIHKEGVSEIWAKKLSDGSYAVGLLNRDDEKAREITLNLKELKMERVKARDLWKHKDIGYYDDSIVLTVASHQCRVLKVTEIKSGEKAHFSPPLGWNSYTGYSTAAPEEEIIKNIDAFSEKLNPYGYTYVTVDNGWFLDKRHNEGGKVIIDKYGRPESSPYFFPNGVQSVIDYAHKKGVKFGVWLIRGVDRNAVEMNLPIEGTPYRLQDIAARKDTCPWNDFNYGVDMSKPGGQEFYNSIIRKYADWGVDFIKYDDIVPHPDEIEAVVKAIENCGREIVLSLSPGDYIKVKHSDAYKDANMVRITSDIWDNKKSLETSFKRWEDMQNYKGAEHNSWLDLDMICFGQLYVVNDGGWLCKFTDDQKRSFILQRALSASPLMAGGVLYSMDEFSLGLLTHPDILKCNQNGKVGKLVHREGKIDVWKTEENGKPDNGWIGIFNRDGEKKKKVKITPEELGLDADSEYLLKDIWNKAELPDANISSFLVPADGCVFIKYITD